MQFDRRSFLKTGAAGAMGVAGLSLAPLASEAFGLERKTKRVILVAFAGGVRTKETFGRPENVPTLVRMADEGVVYTRVRTANLGHFGAAMSLFTGISEARGIRENTRGEDPTVFEYVRKDLGLSAGKVWISTSGGAQNANYSHGLHREYGVAYGANTLDGDGIFNSEFKGIVDAYGAPTEIEGREAELLEAMRGIIGTGSDHEPVNTPETYAQIEKYILDELTSGTSDMRGVGASDAKALRVARNILAVFQPTLLGVVLNNADVAHGSFNSYVEVIRRNDAMLGELWAAVQADEGLRDSTAILVLPEFGRDSDLNSRRGLDHGDGSDDLNYVSCVAWGPDFRRGVEVTDEVRAIDACATVCDLLGAKARYAKGKRLTKLLA
jgi:hypothetical protein